MSPRETHLAITESRVKLVPKQLKNPNHPTDTNHKERKEYYKKNEREKHHSMC